MHTFTNIISLYVCYYACLIVCMDVFSIVVIYICIYVCVCVFINGMYIYMYTCVEDQNEVAGDSIFLPHVFYTDLDEENIPRKQEKKHS